ncbi:hypothetical protein SPBR_08685 [Sporothrix brasiliensis 5110]|uniref:Aminoglycoside phosphotransferase domain-containing protein n=1 Tax=Sporothrix brasiliensis 5110 TaxID=1398154 RepID=A0A0C2IN43_9PEZI|nr:uncharacterized protein SPBR_08685 [Sporothrix brasiliensis 5110]KIH86432.1 hypothetical protein SPBR_08685 [Sporothrix brasiliensis 5110]
MPSKPRRTCADKDDLVWEKLDDRIDEWYSPSRVATIRLVKAHTTIPVPHVYHYGMAADNPLGLGPIIIMDYIDHHQNLSRVLMDPARTRNYAARRSWAFDFLWWEYLDEDLFGPSEDQDHKARVAAMTTQQKGLIESFVARKLEEGLNKEIRTWEKEDAVTHLARYLV